MKANTLMDQMFDIQNNEVCKDVVDIIDISNKPVESIRDLILQFGTNKYSQFTWSVVTWLKLGHIPIIASQDFC